MERGAPGRGGHVIAHVGGIPVEEVLPPLASGLGTGLLLVFTWAASRVRHPRGGRPARTPDGG
jgi:hypothetical protein